MTHPGRHIKRAVRGHNPCLTRGCHTHQAVSGVKHLIARMGMGGNGVAGRKTLGHGRDGARHALIVFRIGAADAIHNRHVLSLNR